MRRSIQVAAGLVGGSTLVLGLAAFAPRSASSSAAVVVAGSPARTSVSTATAAPTAAAAPATRAPTPAPLPPQHVVLATDAGADGLFTITLATPTAAVLATTTVHDASGVDAWSVSAAAGAAYWSSGGALHRLDPSGAVTRVASLPSTQAGRVLVSPDGTQWVYASTATDAAGVITNDIWHAGTGLATQQIVHRIDDPEHPSADAPQAWQYHLQSWTSRGILAVRDPLGGCGCGPFDMQMMAQWAIFIDPVTGATSPITTDAACPLSGASTSGLAACFHTTATGATDAIRFIANGHEASGVALSGTNVAGDAAFTADGTTMAYATIPVADAGCGAGGQFTLRVMDVASHDATVIAPRASLDPVAWLNSGDLLALRGTDRAQQPVSVNVHTGAITLLSSTATRIVGVS